LFGEKLNSELLEIFKELDLSECLIIQLKHVAKQTPRKYLRKPNTPSKICKEEVKAGLKVNSTRKDGKCEVTTQTTFS
jgi:hypothetical protein